MDSPEVSIGRARNPGDRAPGWILLNDDSVSRHHASLTWDEDEARYAIEHKSETNLTFVNEVPLEEKVLLKAGDEIRLGRTIMELQSIDARFVAAARAASGSEIIRGRKKFDEIDVYAPEKRTQTVRPVGMGARGSLILQVAEGVQKGQETPLVGTWVCLTPPAPEPAPVEGDEEAAEKPFFDQHVDLGETDLPPESLVLRWDEAARTYHLRLDEDYPLRVRRESDGACWEAPVEKGRPVLLRPDDELHLGSGARLRLAPAAGPVGREEAVRIPSPQARRIRLD